MTKGIIMFIIYVVSLDLSAQNVGIGTAYIISRG